MTTIADYVENVCRFVQRDFLGGKGRRDDKMPPVTVFYQVNRRHSFYILYILFLFSACSSHTGTSIPATFEVNAVPSFFFKVFPGEAHI